jgi:hypothetical protein
VTSELFERRVKLEDPVTCGGLRLRVDNQPQEHDAPALAVHRVLGAPGTSHHVPRSARVIRNRTATSRSIIEISERIFSTPA